MKVCEHCGASLDWGEICECRLFRVLLLKADGTKHILTIDGSLHSLQKLVGGYIEHVPMVLDTGLLVNEDGIALGLKPNPFFGGRLLGDVVVIGEPKNGGDNFVSLSDYAAEQFYRLFEPKEVR